MDVEIHKIAVAIQSLRLLAMAVSEAPAGQPDLRNAIKIVCDAAEEAIKQRIK